MDLGFHTHTPRGCVGGYRTYFIQAGSGGPVKIGKAVDPERRLRELQTGNPAQLLLLGSVDGDIESDLHRQLKQHRLEGEWFVPSLAVNAAVQMHCGRPLTAGPGIERRLEREVEQWADPRRVAEGGLVKRSSLSRSGPLRRSVPLKRMSAKRRKLLSARRRCLEAVQARCLGRCEIRIPGVCVGRASDGHELLRRSAGGDPANPHNVRAACRPCHDHVHAYPALAVANGWLVKRVHFTDEPKGRPPQETLRRAKECHRA